MQAISVHDLKERLEKDEVLLVDVREAFEHDIARIEPSTLISLGDLPMRFEELPKDRHLVMMCKSGVRSAKATEFLRHQGFNNVSNLEGGIDAWAAEIDPEMARY